MCHYCVSVEECGGSEITVERLHETLNQSLFLVVVILDFLMKQPREGGKKLEIYHLKC